MSSSTNWLSKIDLPLCAVVGFVTTASLVMRAQAKVHCTPGKRVKQVAAPPTPWLDKKAFLVLASIVDAFIPSYTLGEITNERIEEMIRSFDLVDAVPNTPLTVAELAKHRAFLCAGALDYGTHHHLAQAFASSLSQTEKDKIKGLLETLSTSIGSLLLTGYPVPFWELPLNLREKVLLYWRDHPIEQIRSIFQMFKRGVSVMYTSQLNRTGKESKDNPIWAECGYDPDAARQHASMSPEDKENDKILRAQVNSEHVLHALHATQDPGNEAIKHVTVDAVVVGSGCGGGVIAYNLVQAGYTVLVLDKQGYYTQQDFQQWREIEALEKTFDKAGFMSTEDANVAIFAGSCVGGGSVINWSASFATPEPVLADWHASGLTAFDPRNPQSEYAVAMKRIHELFQVNTRNSYREHDNDDASAAAPCSFAMNENNRLLWHLAEQNGYQPEPIPRNVKNCVDCGHCCYGCAYKQKNTTPHLIFEPLLLQQHHRDAHNQSSTGSGAGRLFIIPFCHAEQVLKESAATAAVNGNAATGVFASYRPSNQSGPLADQQPRFVQVRARVTVVCAGAIQTPALLLRSKFAHPGIGRGLSLHPVVPVSAVMTQDIDTGLSRGVSMGVVVRNPLIFAHSKQFPVALQTPPAHTAITSTVMPWHGSLAFKMMMLAYRQAAVFIGISRDQSHPDNRVCIDANGEPVVQYRITQRDADLVMQGLEVMLRLFASDAHMTAMMVGHASFSAFVRHASQSKEEESQRLNAYIEAMRKEGIQASRTQMYSAHQIASVRMASSIEKGPVTPQGALYECANVFVADGSVLPTALGINPMITIESMAQMISQHVIRKLAE